jgi:predicted peptidase
MKNYLSAGVLFLISSTVLADDTRYMSDLGWDESKSESYGIVYKDKNRSNEPLLINGELFTKGIGTHSNSRLFFNVDGQYDRFTSSVGIDDHVGSRGSATFSVYGDGQLLESSPELTGDSELYDFSIDIHGVRSLELRVDGGDDIHFDHANWADAKLTNSSKMTFKGIEINSEDNPFGYYEFLPGQYYTNPNNKLSLIVFFHGRQEGGNGSFPNLSKVTKIALPNHLSKSSDNVKTHLNEKGVIVLAPQNPDYWWRSGQVKSMLDYALEKYGNRLDTSKIYLTGLSSGSHGINDYLINETLDAESSVAAVLNIAHAGKFISPSFQNRNVPYWGITRSNDSGMKNLYRTASKLALKSGGDEISKNDKPGTGDETASFIDGEWIWSLGIDNVTGPTIKVTSLKRSRDAHNAWDDAYKETKVYDWLLSHSNN